MRRSIAAWSESLEGATFEPEEVTDAGDHVIGVVRSRGRGRASGIEVADVFFPVFTFRDGKIVRFEEFSTRDQSLAAAAPSA